MLVLPETFTAADLRVGLTAEFLRDVTEQDVLDFADNSGDRNPLHVDEEYASGTNYGGRIVHGAFQVGLASAMIGMHLPGKSVLLGSVHARFLSPLRYPNRVRVNGEIIAWNADSRSGRLRVTVVELGSGTITADISLGFTFHEDRKNPSADGTTTLPVCRKIEKPLVLVTGATGGIGLQIVETLAENFGVLATINRTDLPNTLLDHPDVESLKLDFSMPDWAESVAQSIAQGSLYGIVHCAWPGPPRGGLLSVPADVMKNQLAYGTTHLIELAKMLMSRVGDQGGRLIAVGSIYGSRQPQLTTASYSLGKAALEQTVQLLAPELAAKRICINAVCPAFVPAGMNKQADQRRQMLEAARVPIGRLCQPGDVAGLVEWLLSPEASFVSGQSIGLTGGQL